MKYLFLTLFALVLLSACQTEEETTAPAASPTQQPAPQLPRTPSRAVPQPLQAFTPPPAVPAPATPVPAAERTLEAHESTPTPVDPTQLEQSLEPIALHNTIEPVAMIEPVPQPDPQPSLALAPIVAVKPDLVVGTILGKGAFGAVYRGSYDGTLVAIKTFDPRSNSTRKEQETARKFFEEEMRIHSKLQCPNIVTLFGIERYNDDQCMLMECATDGTLDALLQNASKNGQNFPERHQLEWCQDISKGVRYLHEQGILHRDLKPGNILVFADPDTSSKLMLKLADLGLALDTHHNPTGMNNPVGSPAWMSPEIALAMLNRDSAKSGNPVCTSASDMYAAGMVFWQILSKQNPSLGNTVKGALSKVIRQPEDERQVIPHDAPQTIVQIVMLCWKKDPKSRPTASDVSDNLANRIQEITDEEAAVHLTPPPPAEPVVEKSVVVAAAPAAAPIRHAEAAPKPMFLPVPQIGWVSNLIENVEKVCKNGVDRAFGIQSSEVIANGIDTFDVVQTNWSGREQRRVLRVTKTHIERLNPIDGDLREEIRIQDINALVVSENTVTMSVRQGSKVIRYTYRSGNIHELVKVIREVRPNIEVMEM